jgi:hypothetical protein
VIFVWIHLCKSELNYKLVRENHFKNKKLQILISSIINLRQDQFYLTTTKHIKTNSTYLKSIFVTKSEIKHTLNPSKFAP